jgi:hypothetical protein
METWSQRFNWIAQQTHVNAVYTGQSVDAANQLYDSMTIVVRSTSGISTTEVHGSYLLADQGRAQVAIDRAVETLDAIEAG